MSFSAREKRAYTVSEIPLRYNPHPLSRQEMIEIYEKTVGNGEMILVRKIDELRKERERLIGGNYKGHFSSDELLNLEDALRKLDGVCFEE